MKAQKYQLKSGAHAIETDEVIHVFADEQKANSFFKKVNKSNLEILTETNEALFEAMRSIAERQNRTILKYIKIKNGTYRKAQFAYAR